MNGPKFDFMEVQQLQYLCAVFEVSRQTIKGKAKKDVECSFSRPLKGGLKTWPCFEASAAYPMRGLSYRWRYKPHGLSLVYNDG